MSFAENTAGHVSSECIKWKFMVPGASWWGRWGLITIVKMPLRKILRRVCPSFEEVIMVLGEVEAVVNSRPLNFTESDADEPRVLAAADLLIGRRLTIVPQGTNDATGRLTRTEAVPETTMYKASDRKLL